MAPTMTDKPKGRGGLRNPPGGRPRKDNVILHCYVHPDTLKKIDDDRGELSRGEYIDETVRKLQDREIDQ